MDRELAMRWVEALRSGKYKQGKRLLKNDAGPTPKYCCLGVLCELEGNFYGQRDFYGGPSILTKMGQLPRPHITPSGGYFVNLASLNDSGLSFKQIASIIEKNYKEL